jgi:hypothetical protein
VVQQEPGLEPNRTSLERPENSCAATLPIQPDCLRGSAEKNVEKLPKYPRRLEAVIAAKGASTKYSVYLFIGEVG